MLADDKLLRDHKEVVARIKKTRVARATAKFGCATPDMSIQHDTFIQMNRSVMGSYLEHDAQWKAYLHEKAKIQRERAVHRKEWLVERKKAERMIQQTYWQKYRVLKGEKMEEIEQRNRVRKQLKFFIVNAQLVRILKWVLRVVKVLWQREVRKTQVRFCALVLKQRLREEIAKKRNTYTERQRCFVKK